MNNNVAIAQTTITITASDPIKGDTCFNKETCSDGHIRFKVNLGASCYWVDFNVDPPVLKSDGTCNERGGCSPPVPTPTP